MVGSEEYEQIPPPEEAGLDVKVQLVMDGELE